MVWTLRIHGINQTDNKEEVTIIKIDGKILVLQYCMYLMTQSRHPNPLGIFVPKLPDLACESKRISRCRLSPPKINTLAFAAVSLIKPTYRK